jgi:thiosulfate dehydrogenase
VSARVPRCRRGAFLIVLVSPFALAANETPAAKRPDTAPVEATPAPCDACHGAHGEGMAAAHVPRIAGQSAEYLKKQLDDYAEGSRDNAVMRNFAKALSEKQRSKLAAHYAGMSAPATSPALKPDASQLARGHRLAFQGDEQERVQACNSCHGPDGIGVLHAAPYLAGQSADYLASALKSFQNGTRKNDAGELMRSVAKQLSDADVLAISGYYAQVSTSLK